jgi:hypothetical protein
MSGELKEIYEQCCNEYARRFCLMYDLEFSDGWWVGGIVGGSFCTDEVEYVLNMDELKLLVDEKVSFDKFYEWYSFCSDSELPWVNLRSYLNGWKLPKT